MQSLRELLDRIRWDPAFGAGDFRLGTWDRVRGEVVQVRLGDAVLEKGNHFSFAVVDGTGDSRRVPFHRVRRVWRDGEVIWSRAP
jgi:uncharacterized protein (UPF0248 family)